MYRGFSLNIENESLFDNDIIAKLKKNNQQNLLNNYIKLNNGYKNLYDRINPNYKFTIDTTISNFVDGNKEINLTDIGENWFPKIEADVFISHSHKDEKLAIKLALWLYYCFGIKAFIDSTVWGYSRELLYNIINNTAYDYFFEYPNSYKFDETLNINSHIDMLLSMALTKMINKCECLIFLNTPNSISRENTMEKTYSLWIYQEIGISKVIKRTEPYRLQNKDGLVCFSKSVEHLIPFLEIDTSHLFKLNEKILNSWKIKSKMRGAEELNYLYIICANRIYRYKSKQEGVYSYEN